MEYLKNFHQWGLKTSSLGLINYMWLFGPIVLIGLTVYIIFGGKKSKALKY